MINFKTAKILLVVFTLSLMSGVDAQSIKVPTASPLQKISQQFALSNIDIEYSRPSAKGRVIFGELVPFGKIWRTGANASTKITFGEDVKVNGHDVKAGTYALYTYPNKEEWKITLYSDLKLGSGFAAYNKDHEVLAITVPVRKLSKQVETFTIQVENITSTSADVSLSWENTEVSFNVEADIDAEVMRSIESSMKDNRPYYQASAYFLQNNKDINKAYEWAVKASEQNPNAYWILLNKARAEFAIGKYKDAITSANLVRVKAAEAGNSDYVKIAQDIIAESNNKLSIKK